MLFAYTAPVMKMQSTPIFFPMGSWSFLTGEKGRARIARSLTVLVKAAVWYITLILPGHPGNSKGSVPQLSEIGLHWNSVAKKMAIHQRVTYAAITQIKILKVRVEFAGVTKIRQ